MNRCLLRPTLRGLDADRTRNLPFHLYRTLVLRVGVKSQSGVSPNEIQEPARALKKHGQTLRGFKTRQHFDVGLTSSFRAAQRQGNDLGCMYLLS